MSSAAISINQPADFQTDYSINFNLATKNNSSLTLELNPLKKETINFIIPAGKECEWEMRCFNYLKRKADYELKYSGIINVE